MTPLIPRQVLFSTPERFGPALSPDGRRLAFCAPVDGVPNLWVQDGSAAARPLTREAGQGIWSCVWAFDGRHLLYVHDAEGDENFHLFALDVAAGAARDLTPYPDVRAEIIALSPERPDEVAVALNDRDPGVHDAYRITIATGEREIAARNPSGVAAPSPASSGAGWITDAQLRVRGCTRAADGGDVVVAVRDAEDAPWRDLWFWSLDDTRNSAVIGFDATGTKLHLIDSSKSPTGRFVSVDVATAQHEVVHEDPDYDVSWVLRHPGTTEPLLVEVQRERTEVVALAPDLQSDVAAMTDLGAPTVLGCDVDARSVLVLVNDDDRSPRFVRYDRDHHQAETLFAVRPKLAGYTLASMEAVRYRSVDGLEIPAYLTRPVDAAGPGPLVVNVHGGPWDRDTWGYRPEVQWLANRGYSVLQPNFRGSAGYGKAFLNAGNREWGAKMLDDVLAGAEWAVEQGIADRTRLGIYGGSFGGYMVLCAIAFAPEVFACAVDICGWSDLTQALKSLPAYWGPRREQWYQRVGHPETDAEFLWSRSPLSRVDDIRTPLLVAQGAMDVRVLKASSDRIVEALRARSVPCEYLVFDDEGHGFAREENRMTFYAAAERFLAEHLGGTQEA